MGKRVTNKTSEPAPEPVTGKVFMNGGSQAIRIPASMRFETEQVKISIDPQSKIVTLEPLNKDDMKKAFIAEAKSLTKSERDEIKAMAFKRDKSIARVNPVVAAFFKDSE
jgi:virulence-associated protein VagC